MKCHQTVVLGLGLVTIFAVALAAGVGGEGNVPLEARAADSRNGPSALELVDWWMLGSVLLGAAISAFFAWRSSAELWEAVDKLHLLITDLALYLWKAGVREERPALDEKGRLKVRQHFFPAGGDEAEEGQAPTLKPR
jgi:hypothetical protein